MVIEICRPDRVQVTTGTGRVTIALVEAMAVPWGIALAWAATCHVAGCGEVGGECEDLGAMVVGAVNHLGWHG